MLLSYHKPVQSSSHQENFLADSVVDENAKTFWVANENKPGEWLTVDLQKHMEKRAVQVNFTDYKADIFNSDSSVYTRFKILASKDNRNWELIADLSKEKTDRPNAYIQLEHAVDARYIKYEHIYVAAPNLAISDFRIFGRGKGNLPPAPSGLLVKRQSDERNADISWKKVTGATGYNILWGIGPDKLYETYQLFDDHAPNLTLRALNTGQEYYFAIEAFNEQGVSAISKVIHIK
jgi:hypothetical protein